MATTRVNTKTGVVFKGDITTITPIHVGNGTKFSPLGDFFIKKDRLYYINDERLSNELNKANKIEVFIESVRKAQNQEKQNGNIQAQAFTLKSFLINQLKVSNLLDMAEANGNKPVAAFTTGNPVELSKHIKTDGKAFIPGSTLKGAIRSALLYGWLINDKNPPKLKLWWEEFKKVWKSEMGNGPAGKEIEKAFAFFVEEKYFGKLKQKKDERYRLPMSCFTISDSSALSENEMAVYETMRFNFLDGENKIPSLKECIAIDRECSITININYAKVPGAAYPSHSAYDLKLHTLTKPEGLCKILNNYSKAVLDYEQKVLNEIQNQELDAYADWLNTIVDFLNNPEHNTAYFRLGHGKLQFYQTIAMKIFRDGNYDEDNKDWIEYLKYCAGFPKKGIGDIYPVTRSLTTIGQMPLGWVKMKIN